MVHHVAASESPPVVVLFPSSMPGRFPLAGSSPEGREGCGSHGGFSWRVLSLYSSLRHLQSQRCEICSAGGARFAVPVSSRFPALRDLQCWKSASFQRFPVARPWIHRFPARFRLRGHGLAHGRDVLFRGVRLLDPRERGRIGFDREVPHDLAVLRQTGPAAFAETRVPLVPTADEPRSWRSFRLERTVRSDSSVTLTMVSIFGNAAVPSSDARSAR